MSDYQLHETQLAAIDHCVNGRLTILNGGAGTGKTHTIKGLRKELIYNGEVVELCAFTGKASSRITEATGIRAKTIHSMLGARGGDTFTRGAMDDVTVIVDESSMVSTSLMAEITNRSPRRLILVGDQAQLAPVGKGQPFHDILALKPELCYTLTKCWRNKEAVFKAATMVRNGEQPPNHLTSKEEQWEMHHTGTPIITHDKLIKNVKDGLLDFSQDIILVCRNGNDENDPCTVKSLNHDIVNIVNPRRGDYKFQKGDRVINTENCAEEDVWNGTTGEVHEVDTKGAIWVKIDIDGRVVKFTKDMAKRLQLAYALTVHKSQGSQYRKVIFVAFERDLHCMLDRSLIYTAITRTKESCIILGQLSAISSGIQKINQKKTIIQELTGGIQ